MHSQAFLKTLSLLLLVAASCKASSNAGGNFNAVSATANVSPDIIAEIQTEPSDLKLKEEAKDEYRLLAVGC